MSEPEPIRITVRGAAGRMGGAIVRLAEADPRIEVVGRPARGLDPSEERTQIEAAAVVVDVTSPDGVKSLLDLHHDALAGRALLVGTTGLDEPTLGRLHSLAGRTAVLVAPNFSPGVNLLLGLVRRAAALLPADRWDAEIVETHHGAKQDAPSGTALALLEALARGRSEDPAARHGRSGHTGLRPEGEVGVHALRGGGVVGEHRVLFLGARERLEIAHSALDRDVFAEGALLAARWLAGRPAGTYTMDDVLAG